MITKDQMAEAIRTLPDDATAKDALALLRRIKEIQECIIAVSGVVTADEVNRRLTESKR